MTYTTDIKPLLFMTLCSIGLLFCSAEMANAGGFVHGIVVDVDGEDYYLLGPPDGPNGERDLPGHEWVQAGPNNLMGKHYNTGPLAPPTGGRRMRPTANCSTWSRV